ncbi:hypothetical protein HOT99_gp156 [Caulobacter phage CcrBL10]|uniref:Uncharacterized protein n=1 Tax=Caulobacter phage CcrBL10 TaxID=2283269 RepID=A0A385E9C0_9CAUD|nr:hypothetical protein HOT99_gp156 [Caulobacter phage CcrBL10]AXQ68461.1 hypothetical protein CcrBL10_gp257 [Caulobacter phage CcrBL10]
MTSQRLDFTSNDLWPPKVDYEMKKLRYDTTLDALEIVHPKNRLGNRVDVSHVASYLVNGRVKGVLDHIASTGVEDPREQTFKILRILESRGMVANTGGDWTLTATGAIWHLVADNHPSGWAEQQALLYDIRLQWWAGHEIATAIKETPYFQMRPQHGSAPIIAFDLSALQQPLDGWNGWR